MVWVALALWFIAGVFWVRFNDAGWLIMITDSRNCRRTWLAYPALILTWLFWPICNTVSYWMFRVAR